MRSWVALLGLSLALSGCIGGHVTSVGPGTNATAGGPDGADADAGADAGSGAEGDDLPPWALRDPAEAKKNASKDPAAKQQDGGGSQSGSPDPAPDPGPDGSGDGTPDGPPPQPPPEADGSDPVQGVIDDAPLHGGNDAGGDVGDAVDETASDLSDPSAPSVPKDPLAGAGDLVGTVADAPTGASLPGGL